MGEPTDLTTGDRHLGTLMFLRAYTATRTPLPPTATPRPVVNTPTFTPRPTIPPRQRPSAPRPSRQPHLPLHVYDLRLRHTFTPTFTPTSHRHTSTFTPKLRRTFTPHSRPDTRDPDVYSYSLTGTIYRNQYVYIYSNLHIHPKTSGGKH